MMIAGHTGWAERWILWYLPFARALQYRHYILAHHGEWTVRPGTGGAARDAEVLVAEFARLRSVAAVYREPMDGMDGMDPGESMDDGDLVDFGDFVDDGDD
jgi:hypothetical protein